MQRRRARLERPLAALALAIGLLAAAACTSHGGEAGVSGDGDASRPPDGPPSAPDVDGAADDGAAGPEDTGPPAVRFLGRFDTRDPAGPWCAWPGCRIVANFDGTRVSVRLNEDVEDWMTGGPSEWDVAIDDVAKPKLVLTRGVATYSLAEGLPPGPHRVELLKRTEAQNGVTEFMGYDFGPDGSLLPPPPKAPRQIEVIGDSNVTGFGVDGVGTDCLPIASAARYQNFHESFASVLAAVFGADVQGTGYSGKGVVRNAYRPDLETIPVLYPRSNPLDATSVFDLTSLVPDVIVILMGGNDFAIGAPVDDGPTPLDQFTQTYLDFVTMLRGHYPNASMFLVPSPAVTDDSPPGRQSRTTLLAGINGVAGARNAAGDTHVRVVVPGLASPSELLGCAGHGTPELHRRIADELAPAVAADTHWN